MYDSEETLQQEPNTFEELLQAVNNLSNKMDEKFDKLDKRLDAQFEAIRQGLVDNNVRLDRLEGNFHLLRAEVTVLVEEIRHNRKVLV